MASTIECYPDLVHAEDLSPDSFGPEIDDYCNEIHAACKGFGTDERRLVKALAGHGPEVRYMISMRYKEMFGKELKKVMKSECGSGDFGTALQFLAVSPVEAECDMIEKACKGLGTDELILYPIICGRSNREIDILKRTYFNLYTKDLGQKLDSELGGDFEKLIFCCLQGLEQDFDAEFHNDDKVDEDTEAFYKMGQGKWGTDEAGLFKLICTCPCEHLKAVNLKYAEKYDVTLFKAMEKELGGLVREATLFLLGMKLKPHVTIAKLIQKACAGFGTNELLLTCCIVRYHLQMPQVRKAYQEEFGKSLKEVIKSETSGDYEYLLVKCAQIDDVHD